MKQRNCQWETAESRPSAEHGLDSERRNHGRVEPHGFTGRGKREVCFDEAEGARA